VGRKIETKENWEMNLQAYAPAYGHEDYDDELAPEEIDAFRSLLSEDYRDLSDGELERLLDHVSGSMTLAEADFLGGLLRTLAPVAQAALPLVGGLVGGPVGGMVGQLGGQLLGQLGGGGRRAPRRAPQVRRAAPRGSHGRYASRQLLRATQTPQFQQAIGAASLPGIGTDTIMVNGEAVGVGSFLGMISSLAERAQLEVAQSHGEGSSRYLSEVEGVDMASPDARADALWELLEQDPLFSESVYALGEYDDDEGWEDAAWDDAEYYDEVPA
jgi:hypothetical protein